MCIINIYLYNVSFNKNRFENFAFSLTQNTFAIIISVGKLKRDTDRIMSFLIHAFELTFNKTLQHFIIVQNSAIVNIKVHLVHKFFLFLIHTQSTN